MNSEVQKRTLSELVDTNDPGWSRVEGWLKQASNQVEVLAADATARATALVSTQVTTKSTLGAVIYESGGLLVDNGWLRIYGSGNPKLTRTVPDWNLLIGNNISQKTPPFLVIADDVIGGFYAIDGGDWATPGHVHYHSPDRLQWEDVGIGYTDFVRWCFTGDLNEVYVRWQNWEVEVNQLHADQGVCFYPFLFAQGPAPVDRHKSYVPMLELYRLYVQEMPRQIIQQNLD